MGSAFDILIVDDEQVIIDTVVKVAEFKNLMVISAHSAEEGLVKLEKHKYQLIICDIMMPEKSGFELMDEIRKREISTPIIITSGYSTLENAVKSVQLGAIDFLPKPFTFDELLSCIDRGLKYSDFVKHDQLKLGSSRYESNLEYVPCPANYNRLGYASWLKLDEEGLITTGITDLFLRLINNPVSIELSELENDVAQGNWYMNITSGDDLIHNIQSPISGKIIDRNEKLLEDLSIIEKDPYFEGWVYKILPSELNYELKNLVSCSSDRM